MVNHKFMYKWTLVVPDRQITVEQIMQQVYVNAGTDETATGVSLLNLYLFMAIKEFL